MNTILEHIHLWTTAQTPKTSGRGNRADNQQLLGIKKLRELILELAVRGKLVPQDPTDEPTSVLLKKIEAEKKRLIKEGKIKRQEVLPEVEEDEKSFDLPKGWEWVRLGTFSEIKGGKRLPSGHSFSPEKTPFIYIQVTNMKNGTIINEGLKYISKETQAEISRYIINKKDLYITIAGTIGDVGIVPESFDGMNLTENAAKIVFNSIDRLWLQKVLSSNLLQRQFTEKTNQLAQPKLALHRVESSCVPLPPLAEQHRIVAKVNELMALCDQLEQQQTENNQLHQTLVETLLANLAQAGSSAEQEEAWQRIANNFNTLFITEYSIDQLKQTILQLAVMGKLAPQDPTDEPASELLKKIAKEKAQLINDKIIKKEKLDLSKDDYIHSLAPKGWMLAYLQDITSVITCGIASTPKYYDDGRIFLSAKNVKPFRFLPEDHQFVDEETYNKIVSWGAKPELGDILLTRVGAGIGEAAIIDQDIDFAYYVSLTLIKPIQSGIYSKFLLLWINSPEGVNKAIENIYGRGVSQGNLNVNQVRKFVIPLPPLAEQHRIVAKVDELFALCDVLKERLAQAQATQNLLAESVVAHALAKNPAGKVVYKDNEQMSLAAEPE